MKVAAVLGVCLMVTFCAGTPSALAQCPTVTSVSPTIIGRALNPASTFIALPDNVPDGYYVIIDPSGIASRVQPAIARRMAERRERMTPEERERFRQGMRGRCGFGPSTSESKGQ